MLKICSIIGFASFGLVLIIYPHWWRMEAASKGNEKELCQVRKGLTPVVFVLLSTVFFLLIYSLFFFIALDNSSSVKMIIFRIIYVLMGGFIIIISGFLLWETYARHFSPTIRDVNPEDIEVLFTALPVILAVFLWLAVCVNQVL